MTATWVAIGVLGAFAAAVLAMVFQILGKVDTLRTELKGDIDSLRRSVEAQTARIDDLVKDVGKLNGSVDALGTRIGHLEEHRL